MFTHCLQFNQKVLADIEIKILELGLDLALILFIEEWKAVRVLAEDRSIVV